MKEITSRQIDSLIKQNGKKFVRDFAGFFSMLQKSMPGEENKNDLNTVRVALYSKGVETMLNNIDKGTDPDSCLESVASMLMQKYSVQSSDAHEVLFCFVEAFGIGSMFKKKYPPSSEQKISYSQEQNPTKSQSLTGFTQLHSSKQQDTVDDNSDNSGFWSMNTGKNKFIFNNMWDNKKTVSFVPPPESSYDTTGLVTDYQVDKHRKDIEQQIAELDVKISTRPKNLPTKPMAIGVVGFIDLFFIFMIAMLSPLGIFSVSGYIAAALMIIAVDAIVFLIIKLRYDLWAKDVEGLKKEKQKLEKALSNFKQ